MGGKNKESALMDALRSGDRSAALKLLGVKSSSSSSSSTHLLMRHKSFFHQSSAAAASSSSSSSSAEPLTRNASANSTGTLKFKINMNYQSEPNGTSFLLQACATAPLDLFKLLVELGAPLSACDAHNHSIYHLVCQHARLDILNYLLAILNAYDHDDDGENETMMNARLLNGATLVDGNTPLHLLFQTYQRQQNLVLPTATESAGGGGGGDCEKMLVLLLTASGGCNARSSLLVRNKMPVGQTPLEYACDNGLTALVHLCIRYGMDGRSGAEFGSYSSDCLHLASRNGHDQIVRLLLANELMDVNEMSARYDGTPLHEACRYGRYQTVKLLLESGIDATLRNVNGQRACDVLIRQHKSGINEIRCLLNEFANAKLAITVCASSSLPQPMTSASSSSSSSSSSCQLTYGANELIRVLEMRDARGLWRGLILNRSTWTSRYGYFPSTHVQLINHGMPFPAVATAAAAAIPSTSRDGGDHTDTSMAQHLLSQLLTMTASSSSLSLSSMSASMSPTPTTTTATATIVSTSNGDDPIVKWLAKHRMLKYARFFVDHGYELAIVVRTVTPVDLLAVGVSEPADRQALYKHVLDEQRERFAATDCGQYDVWLAETLANVRGVAHLLRSLRLEQYEDVLCSRNSGRESTGQSLADLDAFAKSIDLEELEEMGMSKLGHQKKLLYALKKLREMRTAGDEAAATLPEHQPLRSDSSTSCSAPGMAIMASTEAAKSLNDISSSSAAAPAAATKTSNGSTCANNTTSISNVTTPLSSSKELRSFGGSTSSVHHAQRRASSTAPPLAPPAPPPRTFHSTTQPTQQLATTTTSSAAAHHRSNLSTYATLPSSSSSSTSSTSSSYSSTSSSSSSNQQQQQQQPRLGQFRLEPTPPAMPLLAWPPSSSSSSSSSSSLVGAASIPLNPASSLLQRFQLNSAKIEDVNHRNGDPILLNKRHSHSTVARSHAINLKRTVNEAAATAASVLPHSMQQHQQQQQQQSIRNEPKTVLNDIDSMLSDLNRQLDSMLDY